MNKKTLPPVPGPDDLQFGSDVNLRELLRLTPDGRVFVMAEGKAWEIDSQVLFEALRKFRSN